MKPAQAESKDVVLAGADLFGLSQAAEPPRRAAPTAPKPAAQKPKSAAPLDADDLDEDTDDVLNIDLEPSGNDSADTCIAKRMIDRMIDDLVGEKTQAPADLFGHVDGDRETRKLDALIWMYDLNPDGSDIPFVWACNEIGLDPELIRRITARSVRTDLKRILKVLTGMVGSEYAKACELKLSDYINLTGWNLH